jgi:hypothetical protein
MDKNTIPDLALDFIARFFSLMVIRFGTPAEREAAFDSMADLYWNYFSRHLDTDFEALALALPYKKGGC